VAPEVSGTDRREGHELVARRDDVCCTDLVVRDADGSDQHSVDTGLQDIYQTAWTAAAPAAAGSTGAPHEPSRRRLGGAVDRLARQPFARP
jgi:hypothetical protein